MIRTVKNIISILLVVIMSLPMTVQLFDNLFHNHEVNKCKSKKNLHLHANHEKCPISDFVYYPFTATEQLELIEKPFYSFKEVIFYINVQDFSSPKYSFLLRGPPYFII